MISIDFECGKRHRFEGCFKDYNTFREQMDKRMILCPVCNISAVKRIYSGCSIQIKSSAKSHIEEKSHSLFGTIKSINKYIKENFADVGSDFPDVARAMHYGIEEKKNIYGESSPDDVKDLIDEGIEVIPILDIKKYEN